MSTLWFHTLLHNHTDHSLAPLVRFALNTLYGWVLIQEWREKKKVHKFDTISLFPSLLLSTSIIPISHTLSNHVGTNPQQKARSNHGTVSRAGVQNRTLTKEKLIYPQGLPKIHLQTMLRSLPMPNNRVSPASKKVCYSAPSNQGILMMGITPGHVLTSCGRGS